jgi:hypothetical protein
VAVRAFVAQREERQSTGMGAPEAGQCHKTQSKIKEAQSASEKLAIEYQLKYKHSEEYVSLRKPERTATSLD